MEIIKREQAIACGLKRYFTGKPCPAGHIAERHVTSKGCCQCADEYRQKHRPKINQYHRNRHQMLRDSENARKRIYRLQNPGVVAAQSKKQREKHAQRRREYNAKYRVNNKPTIRAAEARRRALELNATPFWFSEFDELVEIEAYDLARSRTELTNIAWHVDHMIPLAARNACGLHVGLNLQVIPAAVNRRKMNRMLLINPMEWLSAM